MFNASFKKELYLDIKIMLFVCIPLVLATAYFSLKVDDQLGLKPFIDFSYNLILFFVFFLIGSIIVWRSYTYLVILKEGSPPSQLEGANKLITIGPYSYLRHPSVIGRLLGIIGFRLPFSPVTFYLI